MLKKFDEKHIKIIFVSFITILALVFAIIQPIEAGPDEGMKMDICKYIAENGSLPHGGDEAVRHPLWGISYGFTPILSYMIGAIFMKITGIFTQDIHAMYVAARLVSVICYSLMAVFVIKIGEKLFENKYYKWIFIIFTTLLPQVLFIGSYINNDSLALLSIAIIVYSWLRGIETKWNIKNCVLLAVGIGLCALSYYNAYGYILTSIIIFIAYYIINKISVKEMFKKGLIISAITLAICGWWFVRSAIIYDGDFLGISITDEYAEKYAIDELKPSNRVTPEKQEISLINMLINQGWLKETVKSFIGVFGGMQIRMRLYVYFFYVGIFALGIIGYIAKYYKLEYTKNMKPNNKLLEIIFGLNIIIPIILTLYYSYYSDYQPQGRYIMPMLIPLMYFIILGLENIIEKFIKNIKAKNIIQWILIVVPIILAIDCIIRDMQFYLR